MQKRSRIIRRSVDESAGHKLAAALFKTKTSQNSFVIEDSDWFFLKFLP
jgi:hypothetical protein